MVWAHFSFLVASFVVLTHSHVMNDLTLMPKECSLKNRAIAGNYLPLGEMTNIGNLPVYEAPENNAKKRMLIAVYDIFGLSSDNVKQVADEMALQSGGFRVALPDFYRGESWDSAPETNLQEWLQRVADWDTVVKPDLINIVQHYKSNGVEEFAIYGMCWGGGIAKLASIELSDDFKASGLVHPSAVSNDEAEQIKVPMFLMPASNDADMSGVYEILYQKFGFNSGHRRFDDMTHGFSGAGGNFSDPLIQERVNEVITKLGTFFDQNLNETRPVDNSSQNIQPTHLLVVTLMAFSFVIFRH